MDFIRLYYYLYHIHIISTNHVLIGLLYILFGFIGGSLGWGLSIIIRLELGLPGFIICSSFSYNSCITFHGILMTFFMIMPLLIGGFGNLLIPFIIGISDMIFPRLNALSLWLVLNSILLLFLSSFIDGGVNSGWTFYIPSSFINYYSIDLLFFSLHIIGLSSLLGSINFISSIFISYSIHSFLSHYSIIIHTVSYTNLIFSSYLNLSLFIWSIIITSLLLIISVPVLAACITMIIFDRYINGCFFDILRGGDVLLFQHLFWFFGHPEAYILILVGFGIISEIISKFSQCIIFGYDSMLLSLFIIGILGCIVWGHHMYIVGFDVDTRTYFTSSTSIIAIPTAIKIINWLCTIWSSSIIIVNVVFIIYGFIGFFSFGGITGLILASSIIDCILHDGYFVVGHFHYVLSLAVVFSIMVGIISYSRMVGGWGYMNDGNMIVWYGGISMIGCLNYIFMNLHYLGIMGVARRMMDIMVVYYGYYNGGNIGVCGMMGGVIFVIMGVI